MKQRDFAKKFITLASDRGEIDEYDFTWKHDAYYAGVDAAVEAFMEYWDTYIEPPKSSR